MRPWIVVKGQRGDHPHPCELAARPAGKAGQESGLTGQPAKGNQMALRTTLTLEVGAPTSARGPASTATTVWCGAVHTTILPKDKHRAYEELRSGGAGVVFRNRDSHSTPGRPASEGPQLRFKFVTTLRVR